MGIRPHAGLDLYSHREDSHTAAKDALRWQGHACPWERPVHTCHTQGEG